MRRRDDDGAMITAYLREDEEKDNGEILEEEILEEEEEEEEEEEVEVKAVHVTKSSGEYASDSIKMDDALNLLKTKNLRKFRYSIRNSKSKQKLSQIDRLLLEIRDPKIKRNATNVLKYVRQIAKSRVGQPSPEIPSIIYKQQKPLTIVKTKKKKKKRKALRTQSSLHHMNKDGTFTRISLRPRLDSLGYPLSTSSTRSSRRYSSLLDEDDDDDDYGEEYYH
jgi:hypothetical protein